MQSYYESARDRIDQPHIVFLPRIDRAPPDIQLLDLRLPDAELTRRRADKLRAVVSGCKGNIPNSNHKVSSPVFPSRPATVPDDHAHCRL